MIPFIRNPLRLAVLATAALLIVAACGGATTGTTTFKGTKKLGLTTTISGVSATYGHAISQSVKMAVDELNASGGVNGYKIEADILDDASDVNKAVQNTQQLVLQDNVVAMIGQVLSSQCSATMPITRQNKTLVIAATCNSYQLTTEPDLVNPYYVSIVPNTYMEGTSAGALAAKLGVKKVFIVSPNYLFGRSETNAFVAALKKASPSTEIVNSESTWYVPFPTNPRWDSTISAIQAAKPDLVYSNIFSA
ncbi:MAG TPA: ABC transporter substrate-binding protein, partial [Candidatus Dormibacteraeota bacterium]|nr:ABC transporter substrate-binding protein [Candidatus Dormibacteraeota bacterium]